MAATTTLVHDEAIRGLDDLLDLEPPTRRLGAFHLPAAAFPPPPGSSEDESDVADESAPAPQFDPEATMSVSADENEALLARVFGDEPTVAAPSPICPNAAITKRSACVKVEDLPPCPKEALEVDDLDLDLPPRPPSIEPFAILAPTSLTPESGTRTRVTPDMVRAAREARLAQAERLSDDRTGWIVAGIWAVAVSLAGLLAFAAHG
jgi:hypothetical protein